MNIKKELVIREFMGESVLVPVGKTVLENNGLFMLTPTAAFIWKLLPETDSEGELVKKLLEEYEVDENEAHKDVDSFLAKLRKLDIID